MISEEAIAHHAALSGAVKVKPLAWKWDRTAFAASGPGGACYRVAEIWGQWMWFEISHNFKEDEVTRKGKSSGVMAAKAKAQKLHTARILAALEPDHTREAERAELARQNAALRAQVASLTADDEALQRMLADERSAK